MTADELRSIEESERTRQFIQVFNKELTKLFGCSIELTELVYEVDGIKFEYARWYHFDDYHGMTYHDGIRATYRRPWKFLWWSGVTPTNVYIENRQDLIDIYDSKI